MAISATSKAYLWEDVPLAVDDLKILNKYLPEVFAPGKLPPGWEKDWITKPIDEPEAFDYGEASVNGILDCPRDDPSGDLLDNRYPTIPEWPTDISFPGKPIPTEGLHYPPPDCFAFYLPFHYYYPEWWGIYIVVEGKYLFGCILASLSKQKLSQSDAQQIARIFLYGHEVFHHKVESFATRLETTHRTPLYKAGFETYFQKSYRSGNCWEERLANAHGYNRVSKALGQNFPLRKVALDALLQYLKHQQPPYNGGEKHLTDPSFTAGWNELAEGNHNAALPIPQMPSELWSNFKYARSGIGNIKSRTKYIIHRNSPLRTRLRW